MKNIFHGLLIVTPALALILFFSLESKEEVKSEQRVQQAVQAVQHQQFDDQFSDAWNGEPGSKIKKQRSDNLADLQKKADQARAKRDELDEMFNQSERDMRDAIRQVDSEDALVASSVASAKGGVK